MDILKLMLQLSETLGWGEMKAAVALPALKEIIDNYPCPLCYIHELDGDHLFALLGGKEILSHPYDWHMLISLRVEIEDEMFHGSSYIEALNEWFK